MELRHLRYFVAVAEELNFRRAAERLFIAQPPLSIQIRQLEAEIGTTLFFRDNRRVSLTPAGIAFLEDAHAILARVDAAVNRAARIGRGDEGCLRVGFASSTTYDLLPVAVRRFRERYPDVNLQLSELLAHEQTEALRELRIDIGLAIQPFSSDGIAVEPVAMVPLVAALPEGHRLAQREEVALRDLDGEAFIQFPRPEGSGFAQFVMECFAEAGARPRLVQITEELQTALGLVSAGLGFTLAPGSVQSLHRDGLALRPLAAPAPSIRLGVTYRVGDASPLVKRFLEVAKESAPTSAIGETRTIFKGWR